MSKATKIITGKVPCNPETKALRLAFPPLIIAMYYLQNTNAGVSVNGQFSSRNK